MVKNRILIVDDELSILKYVSASLRQAEYEPFIASNGQDALVMAETESPALVLLDITMPGIDGFEVLRRLREWTHIPVIMVSARVDNNDKVKCLDLGADDYITKPFSIEELLARVRAVLRRTQVANEPAFSSFDYGDLSISFAQRQVKIAGKEVKLTPTEFNLLQEFILNAGKVLTHAHLLNKVWGPEYRDEREYLHVFVRRLRDKIEPGAAKPRYIQTVSGVGYQFKPAE